jgi:hypothetical protein
MEEIIKRIVGDDKEKEEVLREIIRLIDENGLSYLEIRGAAWEAILMLMSKPLRVGGGSSS